MNQSTFSMLILLGSLLVFCPSGETRAQTAACRQGCQPYDVGCKNREIDCENKLANYKGFMATVGRGVTLFSLPQLYIDRLQRLYSRVDLSTVRFGASPLVDSGGMTDCNVIYFASSDYVTKVRNATLSKRNRDDFGLLYHELRHTEQCVEMGGRDFYAVRWWNELDNSLRAQAFVAPTSPAVVRAIVRAIHDRMPMEADAASRADDVSRAFPEGLVSDVSMTGLTSNLPSPVPVNNYVTWTAGGAGGTGNFQFAFELNRAGTRITSQPFSSLNTFTFAASEEGTYSVRARVRQADPIRTESAMSKIFTVRGAGGATGGNPFSTACPLGTVMAGLNLRTGLLVDAIQAICVNVESNGTWRLNSGPVRFSLYDLTSGTRAGGDGGTARSLMCEPDWGVVGISGRSWSLIDNVSITCGKLKLLPNVGVISSALRIGIDPNAQVQVRGPAGGNGGAPFSLKCPPSQVVTEITGRADSLVTYLSPIGCDNPDVAKYRVILRWD